MLTNKTNLLLVIKEILNNPTHEEEWLLQKKKLEIEANNIKELEIILPEAWVPLRLACSVLLTQRTNLKYVYFPKTIEEWKKVWMEIQPNENNKSNYDQHIRDWIKSRGNHRFAEKFGSYLEDYWNSRKWDLSLSRDDLNILRSLKNTEDVKKWWMQFKGVGTQYAKNLPMDEKDERFLNYIKIDHRLSNIANHFGCSDLTFSEKQVFFLDIAASLNMTGWELDRFCFFFYKIIVKF